MSTDPNVVGRNVRARREALGLSQFDLAVKVGTTNGTISRIERGEVDAPTVKNIQALAETLGCTVDDLLRAKKAAA